MSTLVRNVYAQDPDLQADSSCLGADLCHGGAYCATGQFSIPEEDSRPRETHARIRSRRGSPDI